ncbi:MAG: DUF58 domain-containing protein, partial [Rubrobacteraceae bacterium]
LYVVSASLAGVLAVSALFAPTSARGIEVKRLSPPVGTAGEPLPCTLEIRNTGKFSKTLLEIEDRFAGGSGRALAARVKPGVPERLNYAVENPRRGVYSDGEALVESAAPFGLLPARRVLRAASATTIHPRTFEVAGLPPPASPDAAESGSEDAAAPRRGAGGELWGVREYRPGDPARLIAWRRSARGVSAGRLAVMEMARETEPPFTIALDLDESAPDAAIEMAVSAAASLLLVALREGREVAADAGPQNAPLPENPDRDAILGWCASLGNTGSREVASLRVPLRSLRESGKDGETPQRPPPKPRASSAKVRRARERGSRREEGREHPPLPTPYLPTPRSEAARAWR